MKLINITWNEAKKFSQKSLEKYTLTWNIMASKLKSLSGKYGAQKKNATPIYLCDIATKSWDEFVTEVKREQHFGHNLKKRIRVLMNAKNILRSYNQFRDLALEERKFIAGLPNYLEIDGAENWGFFGSMKGNINFKKRIFDNDINISYALDEIPLDGQITHLHYQNFIHYFNKTLPGNYIATATRLLAMKRPDTFICLNNANRSALCGDFRIPKSHMTYDRYWLDIIERIYDCEWWKKPTPKNDTEKAISQGRAAFLDSLYYLR